MSVAPAVETYTCPVEGCDFAFTGDPDTVKFERRQHELVHDIDEFFDEKAAEPERTIGSPAPSNGKTVTDIANEERQVLLAKTITVRCMDCPDLEWTGPAREARLGWAEHRRDEHHDDTAMRSVDRMDRTITKRDMQKPRPGPGQDVKENLAKLGELVAAVDKWREGIADAQRKLAWAQAGLRDVLTELQQELDKINEEAAA